MTNLANGLPLRAEPPPLRVDEGGAVRVGQSRVSLDLVVEQYENGMSPEDLVRAYDTLELADVHAVIAYYLRHRAEVRAYLKRRQEEAEALRRSLRPSAPASRVRSCSHAAVPGKRPMLRLASDIDDILLIAEHMPEEEIRDQVVVFLPFRG